MDNFLLAVGWWNFVGSIMMLGALNQSFGQKLFNEWTQIFKTPFVLDYWGKVWFVWATGINIFFGLINIVAVSWGYQDVKTFMVCSDLVSYLCCFALAAWGMKAGRLGAGGYSVFVVFGFWLIWGFWSLAQ